MTNISSVKRANRQETLLTARGILTENYQLGTLTGTAIMIDGTAYFMAVGLLEGDVCTGVAFSISTAGGTVTLSKAGLYTKAGVQLAASADQGTGWQTGNLKTVPFSAPYTVTSTDGYYVCLVSKATTLPTPYRNAATTGNNNVIGTGMGTYGTQTGQTDLPSPATIVFTGSPIDYWVAVY